ncbi:hypothetical protein FB45DRAFT_1029722 [Roridomyces roridus]|uniref:Uncharacterized protein n=1 Tax=Roridomyces roridus TaxID=1738132 RepID=A0AAD7BR82_9AGAR|nr:hypothetical protein FB45DRAFT_1029722 [Roridomyces roridus]
MATPLTYLSCKFARTVTISPRPDSTGWRLTHGDLRIDFEQAPMQLSIFGKNFELVALAEGRVQLREPPKTWAMRFTAPTRSTGHTPPTNSDHDPETEPLYYDPIVQDFPSSAENRGQEVATCFQSGVRHGDLDSVVWKFRANSFSYSRTRKALMLAAFIAKFVAERQNQKFPI